MDNNILAFNGIGPYDRCWFEILTPNKRIVVRGSEEFLRKSDMISHIEETTLYKIERTSSGLKRSRLLHAM